MLHTFSVCTLSCELRFNFFFIVFPLSYLIFYITQIVKDKPIIEGRPGESLKPLDFEDLKGKLQENHG